MKTFHGRLWQQDNWFIVLCDELDVATQAGSEAEAAENIQEALALHFDLPESDIRVALEQVSEPVLPNCTKTSRAELSFRQVRFRLEAVGFVGISQKPNHAKFIRQIHGSTRSAILPHYTELAKAVVASILRQADLPEDDFEQDSDWR